MRPPGRELVATCLLNCALSVFDAGADAGGEPVDLDMVVIGDGDLTLDGYVMDSLAFAEWIIVIEEQLDVMVMDLVDTEQVTTIGGFADALVRAATVEQLRAFCDRWATDRVSG